MQNKVAVVIVTYHPELSMVSANITSILSDDRVGMIYVIDNTPARVDFSLLAQDRVYIHCFYENKGIAAAQNYGINMAMSNHADYVALFDQDSELTIGVLPGLLAGMHKARTLGLKLACIGPRPFNPCSGMKLSPKGEMKYSDDISLCDQIIASGQLINVCALNDVGLMDETLFIDGVDHEWCWRAKSKGYLSAIAEDVVMNHALGEEPGNFFGIRYYVGSPVRLYYQFRNAILLSRRHYVPLRWKVRDFVTIFTRFAIFAWGRDDSKSRRSYMVRGIFDGVRGISGPIRKGDSV